MYHQQNCRCYLLQGEDGGGPKVEVYQARPIGTRPRGHPRTRWRDYISKLAWEEGRTWAAVVDRGPA
ncbi:hypothetical protein AOLI_G00038200 [Acnodon oligacanthus]